MKRPLLLPQEKPEKTKTPQRKPDNSLTEKVSGARGKKAMREILKGIEKMDKTQNNTIGNFAEDNLIEGLAKEERLIRVGERMPWEGENTEIPRRELEISSAKEVCGVRGKKVMEGILDGPGKFEKTQNFPIEDLAKDGTFINIGKKMPWKREERGYVKSLLVLPPHEKTEKAMIPPRKPGKSSTEKVSGTRGRRAIEEILKGFGETEKTQNYPIEDLAKDERFKSVGERMPWEEKERALVIGKIKREKEPTAAELRVDGEVLKRLRDEASKMRVWIKVNKAGVTQDVVDQVWITWRNDELAMMKFGVPLKWNMDRAREIVEYKTGGLVVWTNKDTLVVYRGCNYKLKLETSLEKPEIDTSNIEAEAIKRSLYEREADRLLEGLGPRFIDWWMDKPLPVDADLLPEVVPDFKPPFRLCPPHHAKAKLNDYELTHFRNLARPLPTHFVLGRNRKLQGLAAAILKVWEKCHIVKIAIKWGAMNTSNKEMANELKDLTGGVLLLRNKFIIIIYRGKDFVPSRVADQVIEREMELKACELEEEAARPKAIEFLNDTEESGLNFSDTGTLSEYRELQSQLADVYNGYTEFDVQLEAEKGRLEKQLGNQERKLMILEMKIKKSSRELAKLNAGWRPAENDADMEMISEEERACFRKIGLKLNSSLLLGRRGIFKGVIEGIYQHWKHREIAKVITMQRLLSRIVYTAKQLEVETGGILVSVDKVKEGHAIILYRGKNHKRPQKFVSPNLLTKREALSRSLAMQRIGSLKFFAYQRQKTISELKCRLAHLEKKRGTYQREPEKLLPSLKITQ